MTQVDAPDRCAEPPYYLFPNIETWVEYLDLHYPITLPPEHAAALEAERALWSARVAALDGLGDCAGYARMLLKAWREGSR